VYLDLQKKNCAKKEMFIISQLKSFRVKKVLLKEINIESSLLQAKVHLV
jgi:hypothetical protein